MPQHRQVPLHRLLDGAGRAPAQPGDRRPRRLPDAAVPGGGEDRGEAGDPVGVPDGQRLGDHPAHRHADHVRPLDPEVLQQPERVGGHVGQVVGVGTGTGQQLAHGARRPDRHPAGPADVAVVEPDHPEAAVGEPVDHPLRPGGEVQAQAGHEQQRGPVGRPGDAGADAGAGRQVDGQVLVGSGHAVAAVAAVAAVGAADGVPAREKCSSGSTTLPERSRATSADQLVDDRHGVRSPCRGSCATARCT